MKTAGVLALAALGIVAVNYKSGGNGTQLFLSQTLDEQELTFLNWINEHGKTYPTKEEYKFRYEQFKRSMADIASHDEVATGIKMGLNSWSDNSEAEWQLMKGLNMPEGYQDKIDAGHFDKVHPLVQSDPTILKGSVDWVTAGKVTPVKNQGRCGSCWAFGSIAPMESDYAIRYGTLRNYSEQQAVDCVKGPNQCCYGCSGGLMDPTWLWFRNNNQGVVPESQYPYNGRDTNACRRIAAASDQAFVASYNQIPAHESYLEQAINTHPIAVAIEAENTWFRGYRSGVITQGCGTRLDHAVTAVGYGTDSSGQKYFLVKNSWGTGWGEAGYVRIAPNQCGIIYMSSQVVTKQN